MTPRYELRHVIGLTALVGAMTASLPAGAQSVSQHSRSSRSASEEAPPGRHHRHHRRHAEIDKPAMLAAAANEGAASRTVPTNNAPAAAVQTPPERPREAAPEPRAAHGTPLPVRQNRPLTLAPTSTTGDGWKVVFGFATFAVGLYYWKRRQATAEVATGPELRIVRRTPLHDRGELLVVDVAGQRMLLGVTAASVQHLASLEEEEAAAAAATSAATTPAVTPVTPSAPVAHSHAITPARSVDETAARFESMLIAARAASSRDTARSRHRPTLPREAPPEDEVEEQVRGLVSLGVPR